MSTKQTEEIEIEYLTEADIIARIQQLLDANHWTIYRLAKEAKLSYSSINNIFARNTCPNILTLERICCAFHISLSDFFAFKENPCKMPDLTEEETDLIAKYRSLSKKDKQLLEAYLSGLCKC